MKRTTCIILAAFVAFMATSLVTVAVAQPQQMSPDERVAELDKVLSLSAEQKTQIKKILEEDQQRAQDRRGGGGTRPAGGMGGGMGGGMFMMPGRSNAAIEEALTPAQSEKFREHNRNVSVDFRMERLSQQLNLKDNQKTKIRALLLEEAKKTEDLMAEAADSDDRREVFGRMREIREATDAELVKALDKKQAKQYKDQQEEMRSRMRNR